jgi:hypothetical protein
MSSSDRCPYGGKNTPSSCRLPKGHAGGHERFPEHLPSPDLDERLATKLQLGYFVIFWHRGSVESDPYGVEFRPPGARKRAKMVVGSSPRKALEAALEKMEG